MTNERIYCLGVDPGVTTGLALVSKEGGIFRVAAREEVDSRSYGEWDASNIIASWLGSHLASRPMKAIVFEDFVLRRSEMDRTLLAPIRLTMLIAGAVSVLNLITKVTPDPRPGQPFPYTHVDAYSIDLDTTTTIPVVVQQPSQAKTTFSDERLRHYDLYSQTKGTPHARDAARHAATYLLGLSP